MALNSDTLSKAIRDNLENGGFKAISQNKTLCDAIAKAVVEHINSNAVVEIPSGSSAGVYKIK